ncbi:MAG: PEP-CTERM sorting domain-containing protein [Bryobacteraceae bacterium]|jgi:hypothetical protein
MRYLFLIAFTVLLIFAPGAFADDTIYFSSPGNNVWQGVYVNPYVGVDLSQTPETTLTLFCDDYNTEFSGNPTWEAAINPLNPSNAGSFIYGNINTAYDFTYSSVTDQISASLVPVSDPYYLYLQVAFLFDVVSDLEGQTQTQTRLVKEQELSAAAWTLFVNSNNYTQLTNAINNSGSTFASDVALDLRWAAHEAGTPLDPNSAIGSGWSVVTPAPGYVMQEFLTYSPPIVTPEPASMFLLGLVLLGCGRGLARRWR